MLSVLGGGVHYAGVRRAWSKLALGCTGALLLAELSILNQPFEAAGLILLSVIVLAVPLIAMLVWLGREPAALPEPIYATSHPARPPTTASPDGPPAVRHG